MGFTRFELHREATTGKVSRRAGLPPRRSALHVMARAYSRSRKTGLRVSEMALGTWGLSGDAYGPVDEREQERVVERALEMGVSLIETADAYGAGRMERLIGSALSRPRRRRRRHQGRRRTGRPLPPASASTRRTCASGRGSRFAA